MCMIWHMLPGLNLYYVDLAQTLTTTGEELDDLDHDLSHLFICRGCEGLRVGAVAAPFVYEHDSSYVLQ